MLVTKVLVRASAEITATVVLLASRLRRVTVIPHLSSVSSTLLHHAEPEGVLRHLRRRQAARPDRHGGLWILIFRGFSVNRRKHKT